MVRCHPCLSRFGMLHHIKVIELPVQISSATIEGHGVLHKRQMRSCLLLIMQSRQYRNPETSQRLVIATRGRIHSAHSLVVCTDTLTHHIQRKRLTMQSNVVGSHSHMRSMRPRAFRQAARFKRLHQRMQIILRIDHRRRRWQAARHAAIISRQRVYACAEWSP